MRFLFLFLFMFVTANLTLAGRISTPLKGKQDSRIAIQTKAAIMGTNEKATLQGRWAKGPTFAVTSTEDGHVYFGDGAELVCATISNSGKISEQGRAVLPGAPVDIEISFSGDYAYVAMGYLGIAVVDVSSSSDPQLVSVLISEANNFDAKGLALSGSRLFVAAGYAGLWEVTLYQPDSIEFGGNYKYDNCYFNDVAARNDTVFIASNSKALEMLRFAKGQFTLLNRVNYNKYTDNYQNQTPAANAIFWQHDSLFVADSWTGLFFFTVQDTALNYSGFSAGATSFVAARGTHLYSTDYSNVNLFSNNNGMPAFRDSKPAPTSKRLTVWKDWVIVASKSHGVYTFQDNNASTLNEGKFFATSSLTYDVFQQGYYLYRTTPINTLDIISVSNPSNPHTVGHLNLGGDNVEAEKIYVQGDTALVFSYDFTNNYSLLNFVDVSDRSDPQLLKSWQFPEAGSYFTSIVFLGKIIYVALNQDVVAIDFSDLNNIHEAGRVTTSGWIEDLAVQGNYVYTACEDQGMSVVDVSDPAHPAEKATFRQSAYDYYVKIRVQDHYAYIANNYTGLTIIDISNPETPALAGTFTQADGDFNADQLAVSGNYAYIQRGWGEIIFLNVSNPADPRLKGVYHSNGADGLTAHSRMVFVSEPNNGIYAVSNDNPDALADCHVIGEVSGEWTCPKIYLEGDVVIPAGDTLRITDSVERVFALGPYQIKVEGVLIAKGPQDDNLTLSGNFIYFGGNDWHGIYFSNLNEGNEGTSVIENCRFDNADKMEMGYQGGGAIAIYNSDRVVVRHCVFYQNRARLGGAMYIENASPKIEDCRFEFNGHGGTNIYTEGGGAMYIRNANPYLHRLRFTENGAQSGGAMVIDGCSPTLSNVLFDANVSGGLAGAVAITSDLSNPAHPRFVNVTIADNEAANGGGALQLMGPDTKPEIINSILFANAKPEIYINDGVPTVTYSIVDSAGTENWFGAGCLTDNPNFDESGEINYHLKSASCGNGLNSPAIDAGHPDSVDTFLDCSAGLGTARADMGYYGGRYAQLTTGMETAPVSGTAPRQFTLQQNCPNPFNPTTTIYYSVGANAETRQAMVETRQAMVETRHALSVQLIVYNALGQKVATLVNAKQTPGHYSVTFDASGLASGVYFYRLKAGSFVESKKMILIR